MSTEFIFTEEMKNISCFAGEKILLVDDNDLNVQVVQQMMEYKGLCVDMAYNGKEAIEKYENSKDGYYRMIILDINMYGMNGYEVAKYIRRTKRQDAKKIPIYALSANVLDKHILMAKQAGMDGYITKPLDYISFFQMMHDVFEEESAGTGGDSYEQ